MKTIFCTLILTLSALTLPATECGLYVFGGGGVTSTYNIQDSNSTLIDGVETPYDVTLTASNLNGGANLGFGYNFTDWVGLQANFVYWGHQDLGVSYEFPNRSLQQNGSITTYTYGIELISYLPMCCNQINPFAKVGYARYNSDWRFGSNTGIPLEESNSKFSTNGNGLTFGTGVLFAVSSCLDTSFQAQWLYSDTHDIVQTHVTHFQFSINLTYHFRNLSWW